MNFLVFLSALSLPSKLVDKCLSGKANSSINFLCTFYVVNRIFTNPKYLFTKILFPNHDLIRKFVLSLYNF